MKKARLITLFAFVTCGAAALSVTPASTAKTGSAPAVTGKVKLEIRMLRQCDGRNGSTARRSTTTLSNVKVQHNGKVRVRMRMVGGDFAYATDLDGRVTGRTVRGWLRNIESDHGMGSGPGGTDCSTGKSRFSPPPESWVRFRGRSLPGKPRVFRITGGKPENRPTGNYRGPGAKCAGKKADYVGTPGDDRIKARPGSVVVARGGDDYITGKNLTVCAGPGDDRITINRGAGLVFGGAGDDVIEGGPSWDVLHGGPDDDFIRGGAGANTIYGGPGNDRLEGGKDGVAWIFGGPGSDKITGGSVLFG